MEALEERAIVAHRAYIDALTAWERLVEAGPVGSDKDHAADCEAAEADKEKCRIAFRDLLDELGHVHSRSKAGLPEDGALQRRS